MSLAQRDPALHERLAHLVRTARFVFVAGLPGTGKSLVIHQLTHLAAGAGRTIHLLQWDVVRPVFEASGTGQRYPIVAGVTHPMIRMAVGRWARPAIARWDRSAVGSAHLLVGEIPLVGHRLVELARRVEDDAEPLLAGGSCRFVIPVPSVNVRRHVEAERERRAVTARHAREREDAPPHILRELWRDLLVTARALGVAAGHSDGAWDPVVYRRVYDAVLRHRPTEALPLDTILPTSGMSVYEFAVPCADLIPSADEAEAVVRDIEARHAEPAALAREVERWWVV